jgi:hypothetical protein
MVANDYFDFYCKDKIFVGTIYCHIPVEASVVSQNGMIAINLHRLFR